MELCNKRIVVTGGTSGIGYAMTQSLYADNEVIVIARDADKLQQLKQIFKGVVTYQADLSKLEGIENVGKAIAQDYDSIDVLIHNAAVQNEPTFLDEDFKYENIHPEITLNFTCVCSLTYLLLPALLHDNRAIVLNINSALSLAPKTSSAVYCATKGALNIFSQSLRYQLEQTNIKVQQVFLELVDTNMTKGRGTNKMTAEEAARKILIGLESEVVDNHFGKVKLLRILLRVAPTLAHKIMQKF